LAERRRALELQEEAIILTAQAQGVTLPRRADASPDIVLRVLLKP
jgi:hypothetical protein